MATSVTDIDMEAARADLLVWVKSFLGGYARNLEVVEEEEMASVVAAGALHYAALAYQELGNSRAYAHCRLAALCLVARKDAKVYSQGIKDQEEASGVSKQLQKLAKRYERLGAMGPQVLEASYDGTARGASIEVFESAARGLAEQMEKVLEAPMGELVETAGGFELLGGRLLEAAAEINHRRRNLGGAIACWASLVLLDGIEEEFNLLQRIESGYCELMNRHLKKLADSYLLAQGYDWLFEN